MIEFCSSTLSTARLEELALEEDEVLTLLDRGARGDVGAVQDVRPLLPVLGPVGGAGDRPDGDIEAREDVRLVELGEEPAQEILEGLALALGEDEDELVLVGMEELVARLEEALDPAARLVEYPFAYAGFQGLADGGVIIAELNDQEAEALPVAAQPEVVDRLLVERRGKTRRRR